MMRCDFCGYEFKEEDGKRGCQSCPMSAGCQMVKCPRCNYEIPRSPEWLRKLEKLFAKAFSARKC